MTAAGGTLVEAPFERVADVRRHVVEIGDPLAAEWHAAPVVGDPEEDPAAAAPAGDGDAGRPGVDAVLHQLRDRLLRIGLRARDDLDRRPLVADLEAAARLRAPRPAAGSLRGLGFFEHTVTGPRARAPPVAAPGNAAHLSAVRPRASTLKDVKYLHAATALEVFWRARRAPAGIPRRTACKETKKETRDRPRGD